MFRPLACLLLTAAAIAPMPAADLSVVPETHRWVLHLDVAKALDGAFGTWYADLRRHPTADARLQLIENLTGMTLSEDISGITLTGIDGREEEAVMVAHGRFDRERLTTLVRAADGYVQIVHGDHHIHHWKDGNENHYASLIGTDTLVMAGHRQPVQRCLDTIAGVVGSLADDAAFEAVTDSEAAIVVAAANKMDAWQNVEPRTKLLREMERLHLTVREAEEAMLLEMTVTAKQVAQAERVQQVVQGLIALYALGHGQQIDPNLQDLLQGLEVERTDAEVTVSTSFPTAKLLRALSDKVGVPTE